MKTMKPIIMIYKNKKIIKALKDKIFLILKLPIKDRKKYVISLHEEGYTDRQIAKQLHMSTRDIIKIRKDNEREKKEARDNDAREKEEEEQKILFSSKRAEALQLYKKGTSPLGVAIELKISAEEAKGFHQEYCSLLYPSTFLQLYIELNKTDSFKDFIDLFHLIREKELSIKEGIEAIEMVKDISLLKKEHHNLANKIANLKRTYDFLVEDNKSLKYQNKEMEQKLYSIQEEIDMKEKALEIITKKIRQQEENLHKINSGEGYLKARETIKLLVGEFLNNKTKVISLSVTSIINALKIDSNRQFIIDCILNSDKEQLDPKSRVFLQEKLRECAEKIYNEISEACTDAFIHH